MTTSKVDRGEAPRRPDSPTPPRNPNEALLKVQGYLYRIRDAWERANDNVGSVDEFEMMLAYLDGQLFRIFDAACMARAEILRFSVNLDAGDDDDDDLVDTPLLPDVFDPPMKGGAS